MKGIVQIEASFATIAYPHQCIPSTSGNNSRANSVSEIPLFVGPKLNNFETHFVQESGEFDFGRYQHLGALRKPPKGAKVKVVHVCM